MIKLQVNRAKKLFETAASLLSNDLDHLDAPPVFSYWCRFFGENPDETNGTIKLIEPAIYNDLESKSKLNGLVTDAGIHEVFPATYTRVADALAHRDPVNIWFIKPVHLSGGRGIRVISRDELAGFNLPQFHIIQEGVDEIALIGGRKFTARIYVLIWNKKVFMFNDGFVLIHGHKYTPGSTDYGIQVDHRGFQEDKEGGVTMEKLSDLNIHSHILVKGARAVQQLGPVFKEALEASSPLSYILLGIDLLVLKTSDIRFIEINAIPNFIHSKKINQGVNIPLFYHMMRLMYGLKTPRYKMLI